MSNYIIGVCLGNNTSACVASAEQGVVFAISEERLINEKNTKKFPINAIRECVKVIHNKGQYNLPFVFASYEVINMRTCKYIPDLKQQDFVEDNFYETLRNYLVRNLEGDEAAITFQRVEHHEGHRLPAVYLSGFLLDKKRDTIAITYDGFGDGLCATVYNCTTKETLARVELRHSLALVYQFVTGALGFKEHLHEGKITGLAAFGVPKYDRDFESKLVAYDSEAMSFITMHPFSAVTDIPYNKNIQRFDEFISLRNATYNFVRQLQSDGATREDIAASVQAYTENMLTRWLSDVLKGILTDKVNIVLSGGLFANVKVNYAIKRIFQPHALFVLPPMGDEGTSIGAAIKGIINQVGEEAIILQKFAEDVIYYGKVRKEFCYNAIMEQLKGMEYEVIPFVKNMAVNVIVDLMQKQKIVCISKGDSEFGPRALGNHTILYDASLRETNDWLNKRLNRTEFMPFAPIVLDTFKDDLFEDTKGLDKTLKYMTIALPVKQEFADNYKAACHVDNTARPQVISYTDNDFMYEVLKKYYAKTGKKAAINTSFNIHNYPIIASDRIAIDSFVAADLDALVLQNAIIVKRGLL
jgi:carbamoyltransferase